MLYSIMMMLLGIVIILYSIKKTNKEEIDKMTMTREHLLQEKEILAKMHREE